MTELLWEIYKITFPNGKAYIGLSRHGGAARYKNHLTDAQKGSRLRVHAAIRKYGSENLIFEILTTCYSLKEANVCERALIASHGTLISAFGYNMNTGGDSFEMLPETKALIGAASAKRIHTEEEKEKRRKSNIGKHSQPHKINRLKDLGISRRGISLSNEVKAKMSASHTGKPLSEETKLKMKAAWEIRRARNQERRGFTLSEEHKQKISAANKGKSMPPISEETKAQMAISQTIRYQTNKNEGLAAVNKLQSELKTIKQKKTDRNLSQEHKDATAAGLRGKSKSDEHKAALKAASKLRWDRFREERAKRQPK